MTQSTQFAAFAYPGSLQTRTGGYIYDARIIGEWEEMGLRIQECSLEGGFPWPGMDERARAMDRLHNLPKGMPLIVDGLALGALGDMAAGLAAERTLIALVHHPLALETGLASDQAQTLKALETQALAHAAHVIVTSWPTCVMLSQDYGVAAERITVAEPGFDPKKRARPTARPIQILAVGTISRRKDFRSLVKALEPIKAPDWQLRIAGSLTRDPDCAAELTDLVKSSPLAQRVIFLGEIDEPALNRVYRASHFFVSSSRLEGYGMAMMDAISYGLPVLAVRGGAVEGVLPKGAAILINPDDPMAFTKGLEALISDPLLRQDLGSKAWEAAGRLPQWRDSAERIAEVIKRLKH